MIRERVATWLFRGAIALVLAVVVFIEGPNLFERRSCVAYMYAGLMFIPAAYLAGLMLLISTLLVPLWRRIAVFLAVAAPYPAIVLFFC